MMPSVEEDIRDYIAQNTLFSDQGYPHPDEASLLDEGIIDSLNVMDLVSFLEQKYGFSVGDREVVPENFDSVSKLAAFVHNKTSARS